MVVATMDANFPWGWYPGFEVNRVIPHGDDREGIQYLYPEDEETRTDVAVLNFTSWRDYLEDFDDGFVFQEKIVKGIIGVNGLPLSEADPLCPGELFKAVYNFGNPGDVPFDFDLAFYLSFDEFIDGWDALLDVERWWLGSGAGSYGGVEGDLKKTMFVPSWVLPSVYRMIIFADYADKIREYDWTNNVVALAGKLPVGECPADETLPNIAFTSMTVSPPADGSFRVTIMGAAEDNRALHNVVLRIRRIGEESWTDLGRVDCLADDDNCLGWVHSATVSLPSGHYEIGATAVDTTFNGRATINYPIELR